MSKCLTSAQVERGCVGSAAPPDWKPSPGNALPPQLIDRNPPSRLPTISTIFPGWWDEIRDYHYGMNHYNKFTNHKEMTWEQFKEDQEGNCINFWLNDTDEMRWTYWPGTCPYVGQVNQGEVIAPPGLESVLKMEGETRWAAHSQENNPDPKTPRNIFEIPYCPFGKRAIHHSRVARY